MPAPPLSNNFDGGSDGTTIATTDTGSGDQWNAVTIGASCTCKYSNLQKHSGGLGGQIVMPASAAITTINWTGLGSLTSNVWFRVYLFCATDPTNAGANGFKFLRVFTNAGALSTGIQLNGSRFVVPITAADVAIAAGTGTVAMSLNQWVRMELQVLSSTTVGAVTWRLFNNADSTTTSDTGTASSQVLGANSDETRFGICATSAPSSYTFYMDDPAVSTVDWLGPSATPQTPLTVNAHLPFMS